MDGTLVDTEPYWIECEYELVAEFGGHWSQEKAHSLVGNDLRVSAAIIRDQGGVDLPIDDIVAEWNEAAAQVEPMAKDFGPAGAQWVFDFSTHEHDIRGALDAPGARDADTWWISLEFITPGFHAAVAEHRLPPLRIVTGPRIWAPEGVEPVETLTADPFEFGRAISGRRSLDQIRAFDWSTDPEPYLAAFTFGPFTPRAADLVE